MKNYLDLQGIDTLIPITIEIEPIGIPQVDIVINGNVFDYEQLRSPVVITDFCQLLTPITIELVLSNKHYTTEYETAVVIRRLAIDNINLIPQYAHLAKYHNDHNQSQATNYLGFNGKWALTFDRPFYQWLHQTQGQGWLLS